MRIRILESVELRGGKVAPGKIVTVHPHLGDTLVKRGKAERFDGKNSARPSSTKIASAVPNPFAESTVEMTAPAPEDMDREDVKAKLVELGVDFNPRARTDTLRELLDTATDGDAG